MTARTWPEYSRAFLHDAARCLALIHQGKVELNTQVRLQMSSVTRLAHHTALITEHPRPCSEAQAPGISFLIGLVGCAGLVGVVDGELRLSGEAFEWLARPAEGQLDVFRQTWFLSPEAGWRWLRPDRRRHSLDSYQRFVVMEAAQAVAVLSPTAWTPARQVIAGLEAQGVLTRNEVAFNLPQVRRATVRRMEKILHLLCQDILPCLGLAETRGEGDEVLLRPTPEGAAWLQAVAARRTLATENAAAELPVAADPPCFPPAGDVSIAIGGDLALTVPLAAPAVWTFDISHLARLLSPEPPARYRITRQSLREAVSWDYSVSDVIFLLSRFGDAPLTPAAAAQLDEWRQEITRITCEEGYRLSADHRSIVQVLRRREPFRRCTQPLASGQDVWVSRAEARGLFRYLRRRGYVLTRPESIDDNKARQKSWRRRVLPLPQLLIALRTYRLVRRSITGLADLGLDALERDIAAALPPMTWPL